MSGETLQADVRVTVREGRERFRLEAALDAPPGVTVLAGPSGAGKSLTLACIAGLARIDEGSVRLGEERDADVAPRVDVVRGEQRVGESRLPQVRAEQLDEPARLLRATA